MPATETSEEELLAAVIAALNSEEFEARLHLWLHRCLEHDNLTIVAYFQNHAPVLVFGKAKQASVHQNIAVYLSGAYLLDPFHHLHITKAPAGLYRLSDIAPDKFRANQYYLDYYRNTSLIDEIGFVTYPSAQVSLHVCLGRDKTSNLRFSARKISRARRIAPIVAALSTSHWGELSAEGEYVEDNVTQSLIEAIRHRHEIVLSPRQAEVALLVLQGHSSVSIGLKLGISAQTVKVFRKQLYKKCRISSQAELFTLMLPLLGAPST